MKIKELIVGGATGFFLGAGAMWCLMQAGASYSEKLPSKESAARPMIPGRRAEQFQKEATKRERRAAEEQTRKVDQRQLEWQARSELEALVKPLTEGALQLNDEARRAASLEKIREAILSGDPLQTRVGLTALGRLSGLSFDKASFRPAILPFLESTDIATRGAAWWALMATGLQDGDAGHMRKVAKAGGMGEMTSFMLFRMEKGDLTGESGEIIRGMIDRKDEQATKNTVNSTWGSKYSPALEADLIALSREPAFKDSTIYSALSTQQNKSRATIERLLEVINEDPNGSNAGRSLWGLQQGVAMTEKPMVADLALKIVSTRESGYSTENAWRLVEYAGIENLPALRALAQLPNLSDEKRQKIVSLINGLESPK